LEPRQSAQPWLMVRYFWLGLGPHPARNLEGFTRDQPSITNELQLPDWDQPVKLAWPPPQTPLAVLAVQGMAAAVDHAGANWWQRRDERQR
jgi:hypothetical protein